MRERGSVRSSPLRDRSEDQQPGETAAISASAPERCDVQGLREGVLRPRRGLQLWPCARGDARVSEGGGSVEVEGRRPRRRGGREGGTRAAAVPGLVEERQVRERGSVRSSPLRDRSEDQQPGETAAISASAPERCDVQVLREGVLRPRRGLQLWPCARGDARVSEGGGSVEVAKERADPRTAGPGVRRVAVPGLGVERRVSERGSVRAQPLPHEREHSGENRGVIGTALVCRVGSVRSVESV